MFQSVRALEAQLPHAALQAGEGVGCTVPVVEIADEMYLVRAGKPFAEYPAVLSAIEPVVHVSVGKG